MHGCTDFGGTPVFKKVCIFSGNANPALAQEIAQVLEMPLGQVRVSRFSDGETFCEIHENVRGVDSTSSSRPARR